MFKKDTNISLILFYYSSYVLLLISTMSLFSSSTIACMNTHFQARKVREGSKMNFYILYYVIRKIFKSLDMLLFQYSHWTKI
jgi:hypothetical protein